MAEKRDRRTKEPRPNFFDQLLNGAGQTKMTYEVHYLDDFGKSFHQELINKTMVEAMDYEKNPFDKRAVKDIHRKAFDFALAKQVIDGHKTAVDKGIADKTRSMYIRSYANGEIVGGHAIQGHNVTPNHSEILAGNLYKNKPVYDPMGIRLRSWKVGEVMSNDSYNPISQSFMQNQDHMFLSLRGLGLNPDREIDKSLAKSLFQGKGGKLNIRESGKDVKMSFEQSPVFGWAKNGTFTAPPPIDKYTPFGEANPTTPKVGGNPATAALMGIINNTQQGSRFMENGKPIMFTEAGRPFQLKSNGHKNYRFKGNQKWTNRFLDTAPANRQSNPLGAWDPSDLPGSRLSGNPFDLVPTPGESKMGRIPEDSAYFNLEHIRGVDPRNQSRFDNEFVDEAGDRIWHTNDRPNWSMDADGKYRNAANSTRTFVVNSKTGKTSTPNKDSHKFRLGMGGGEAREMSPWYKSLGDHDINNVDDQNRRRYHMLNELEAKHDYREGYQHASRVVLASEVYAANDIELRDGSRYYNGTKMDETFDVHGRPVFAAFSRTDGQINPYKYLSDSGQRIEIEGLSLEEMIGTRDANGKLVERTPLTTADGRDAKANFVLTDYGLRKAEESQKRAGDLRRHTAIIDMLKEDLKKAKDEGKMEQIQLRNTVGVALGLNNEPVRTRTLFTALDNYFTGQKNLGLNVPALNPEDISIKSMNSKNIFDTVSRYVDGAKYTSNAHVWKDVKQWNAAQSIIRDEHIELKKFNNLQSDNKIKSSDFLKADHDLGNSLYQEEEAWDAKYRHMMQAQGGVEGIGENGKRQILNMIHQSVVNSGGTLTREEYDARTGTSVGGLSYDDLLKAENEKRSAQGLDPINSLDAHELKRVHAPEEKTQAWRDYKQDLDGNNAVFRMKDDLALYNVKDVYDTGTVVAERVSLPASAFRADLTFNRSDNIGEELGQANKAILPEDDYTRLLTDEQRAEMATSRATAVKRVMKSGAVQESIANAHLMDLVLDSPVNLFAVTGATGKNSVAKSTQINEHVLNAIQSRAGWMLRPGADAASDLASSASWAWMDSVRQANEMNLETALDVTRGFDQRFEDLFIKNLHKAHFSMKPEGEAADKLIMDTAEIAQGYLKKHEGKPGYENMLMSETNRLLQSPEVRGVISEDFSYYNKALDSSYVADVLKVQGQAGVREVSSETVSPRKRRSADTLGYDGDDADAMSYGDSEEVMEARKLDDRALGMAENTKSTSYGDSLSGAADRNLFNITDAVIDRHVEELHEISKDLETLNKISEEQLEKKTMARLKGRIGEEAVNEMIQAKKDGNFSVNKFDIMNNYFENRIQPAYGDQSLEVMQRLYGYKGNKPSAFFDESYFADMFGGDADGKSIGITSPERLRNIIELGERMPSLGVDVQLDRSALASMVDPKTMSMIPDGDEFSITSGQSGQMLARSKLTNHTFAIEDTVNGKVQSGQVAFDARDNAPDYYARVDRGWARDGTNVAAPEGKLPIALNAGYNSNRITRSPMGLGHLGSSDIGTRQNIQRVLGGEGLVGVDFETTGFLGGELDGKGLILPTEVYMQPASMKDGALQMGEGTHLLYNVGDHTIKDGRSVREYIGGLTPDNASNEDLGLMRNIAKYSLGADKSLASSFVDFNNVSNDSFNFNDLQGHATMGLDRLATGAGIPGAKVMNSLPAFMQEYSKHTDNQIQLMQNGADADVAWANAFSEGKPKRPDLIEMMHVSRMILPDQMRDQQGAIDTKHNLRSQIIRSGDTGLLEAYDSGSHLADTDTKAMTELFGQQVKRFEGDTLTWAEQGTPMMKLSSTGSNKIVRDLYTVGNNTGDLFNKDANRYELNLNQLDASGKTIGSETLAAPSLQELQRNISQNYKGFGDMDEALNFRSELAFDDAREDLSRSFTDYDRMLREVNRAKGDGTDAGLEGFKNRYDQLRANGFDFESASDIDRSVVMNERLGKDGYAQDMIDYDLSNRQQRAMTETNGFLTNSVDTEYRMNFLEEVKNMEQAGVVTQPESRNMIAQYNASIKAKAAAIDRAVPQRVAPGMVDLGTFGEGFGSIAHEPMTLRANTYSQAESGLYGLINKMEPEMRMQSSEGAWRSSAIQRLGQELQTRGVMGADEPIRMETMTQAVMNHLDTNGPSMVDDITSPMIQGPDDGAMHAIFDNSHKEAMSGAYARLAENPHLESALANTTAMRDAFKEEGMNAPRLNLGMPSTLEGVNLPTSGEFALRRAGSMLDEINALGVDDQDRHGQLWKEIFNRATGEYDDVNEARGILGWDSTPDNYVHPFPVMNNKYPAGTKYSQMDYYSPDKNDLLGIIDKSPHTILRENASEYVSALDSGLLPLPENARPLDITEADDAARKALQGKGYTGEYIDEDLFDRPLESNRPRGELFEMMENAAERSRNLRTNMMEMMPSKGAIGIIGAVAGAAFVARQWTRGDMVGPEAKPSHNQEGPSSFEKESSPAYTGNTAPSGGQTYLTEDSGYNVQVSASNRNGVSQDQISGALSRAVPGSNANMNVQHRDDTSSINNEWLRGKFTELLDNGFTN